MIEFEIKGEYIELIKLLKACGIADSGADAKLLVAGGEVKLNDTVDLRFRAKIRKGDIISCGNKKIRVS
jgi:ribosome-associated protein